MAVIDSGVYVGGSRVGGRLEPLDAVREARAQGGIAWISLSRPRPDELQGLAELLELHPLAIRDTLKGHQRAKLERYGDLTFLVLQPARYLDASRDGRVLGGRISSSGPTSS